MVAKAQLFALRYPPMVTPGNEVDVQIGVKNSGNETGAFTANLVDVEASRNLTAETKSIPPGESRVFHAVITVPNNQTGIYPDLGNPLLQLRFNIWVQSGNFLEAFRSSVFEINPNRIKVDGASIGVPQDTSHSISLEIFATPFTTVDQGAGVVRTLVQGEAPSVGFRLIDSLLVTTGGKNVMVMFFRKEDPLVLEASVAGILVKLLTRHVIIALLVLLGLVVVYAITDKIVTSQISLSENDFVTKVADLVGEGKLTPEQGTEWLTSYRQIVKQEGGFLGEIRNVIIIAVAGGVAITAISLIAKSRG